MRVAIHFIICLGLVFLFGGRILSLSIDFAFHYGLIDALMKTGTADPQIVGAMSGYPKLGHWIAAGLGYLIGSGVVAMWLVSIVSIYVCYYCLARIAGHGGRLLTVVGFVALVLLATQTYAIVGDEVVGNFFYPQLVGTAVYFATLLMLVENRNTWLRLGLALGLFAFTLEIHTVPALHLAAAFFLLLVIEAALEFFRTKRLSFILHAPVVLFPVGVLLTLGFDPSLRTAVTLAQSGGVLDFKLDAIILVAMAVAAGCVSACLLWIRLTKDKPIPSADLVIFAALWAAIGLILAQYIASALFANGSSYIVKKHVFIVLTLGILSLARLAGDLFPVQRSFAHSPILAAGASAAICAIVLWEAGISLYPIVRDLEYAERASSFPKFKPGNTFAAAESMYPVVRYLISITAFRSGVFDSRSIALVNESFLSERDASFVLMDRTDALAARCDERYAETPQFVIVPSYCVRILAPDGALSFNKGGNGGLYLSHVGWWPQEDWGVWVRGTNPGAVTVGLPLNLQGSDIIMSLTANVFVGPPMPELIVDVTVNHKQVATLSLPQGQQPFIIPIARELTESGLLKIAFVARDAISPLAAGHNADGRVLGLGLKTLKFEKAVK
jgi:hypothetical protein